MTTTAKPKSLFQKVWDAHRVRELPSGQTQLFIGPAPDPRGHEPAGLRDAARARAPGAASRTAPSRPSTTSSRPTTSRARSPTTLAEEMMQRARAQLPRATASASSAPRPAHQGIVHVIGPELGLTQPGMTIACGDSHTSTHGAFGAIAFGIGTSQVRDVLATQCLAMAPLEGPPHRGERASSRPASTPRT